MKPCLFTLVLLLCSCASLRDKGAASNDNPFHLSEQQIEELLASADVFEVSATYLSGICPNEALQAHKQGKVLVDCVKQDGSIRVYLSREQTARDLALARNHAASHIYDVQVRRSTHEQSARHEGW